MRVYSSSQGRFIDIPDAGMSSPSTTSSMNTSSATPPVSDMAKILAALSLKKKDYQTTYDLLNPKPDPNIMKEQQLQQKNKQGANQMNELVKTLEGHYQKGGGGETNIPILSNILGVKQNIQGALNWNPDITQYNAQKAGFIAALKGLTGDVGVMTDQDAIRLMNLFPKFGDRGDVASGKFNDIRNFIATKFGTTKQTSTYTPENKNALQVLLPNSTNIAQDVGTGIRGRMEQGNLDKQSQMAKQLEDRAYATRDLTLRKTLLKQANNFRTGVSNEAGDISHSFSKDVNGNPLARGLAGGAEIGTAAEIPGAIKSGISTVRKVPDLLKGFSGSAANQARAEAAKGITINTKDLIKAGDDYVKNIDPAAAKAWATLKPAIKPTTKMDELLTKLTTWSNKAYTQSGDKRAITEGLLKSHLVEQGRKTIAEQAPNITELTTQIGKGIGRKKLAGKVASRAGSAVVTGGTFALLNKLLGGVGNNSY